MGQSCRDSERFNRLGGIERANVGAEGSQQVIVPGASMLGEASP